MRQSSKNSPNPHSKCGFLPFKSSYSGHLCPSCFLKQLIQVLWVPSLERNAQKISKQLTDQIRRERLQKGISLTELAQVAGIDRRTLTRIEGGANPTIRSLALICLALDVEFGDFVHDALKG